MLERFDERAWSFAGTSGMAFHRGGVVESAGKVKYELALTHLQKVIYGLC